MFTETQRVASQAALVRFHQGNKAIGAGLFFQNGYVLTCSHVVTQGLGLGKNPKDVALDSVVEQPIKLDFPFIAEGDYKVAKVVPELWRLHDRDIAVLSLDEVPDQATPLPFQPSTHYCNHPYRVYGFPAGHPGGIWSQGEFLSELAGGWVQMEGTRTQGIAIEPGFSGAPVWDDDLGRVVGITVARDQEREEAKIAFMIPYQRLKAAIEAVTLFDLLLPEAASLEPFWQRGYQLLRPKTSAEPKADSLPQAILQLQDMSPQGSSYRAIVQFIGYLCLSEIPRELILRLCHWLQDQMTDVDSLLKEMRHKLTDQQAKRQGVLAPHLLFWVQAEMNSDRYSVQAYLVDDREQYEPKRATQLVAPAEFLERSEDGKVNGSSLEEMLRRCLDESIDSLLETSDLTADERGLPNLTVNVFVPLSCLCWYVDRWGADDPDPFSPIPEPIGSRYHLVLRMAERLNKKFCTPQRTALWMDKWKVLSRIQGNPATKGLVPGDGKTEATLMNDLRSSEIVGFYLVQAPPAASENDFGRFPLLVGSGSPVAIWLRQDVPDECQQGYTQLLNCSLAETATVIREQRQIALGCNDGEIHIGQHIGLIWEDPHLVPPIADQASRLRMSV